MTTVTAGLFLARAQFSLAVRPLPSHTGRVAKLRGFSSRYVWVSRVLNNSTSPARFHSLEYYVLPNPKIAKKFNLSDPHWGTREDALQALERIGLKDQVDFDLRLFSTFSLSSSSPMLLGIFSTRAMSAIESLIVRITISDQAGDSRQWKMDCLIGAIRNPKHSHSE
jgi:hypothetical protein